eukprot:TRINITY_DN928_c0_g1_i1.p1 TRINITY_DN928_c0_g1~~TRINITY_DN928_c0_g1_i1.p1  ORF type:complete len:188 (-),score=39.23 TRINITY_DN928_c0_g1_i1:169-732(-)
MGTCPLYKSDENLVTDGDEHAPEGWDPDKPPDDWVPDPQDKQRCKVLFEICDGNTLSPANLPKSLTPSSFRTCFTNRPIGCHMRSVEEVKDQLGCTALLVLYGSEEQAELAVEEHHGRGFDKLVYRVRLYCQVLQDLKDEEERRSMEEAEQLAEQERARVCWLTNQWMLAYQSVDVGLPISGCWLTN